ncbi:Cloroperoxidase [Macroventuria anomochaeta]|uniref:Cloroperoxidase n=1 Tax=Macroventuria anomochaeta TaxID=301207 RepID=A0ACB6SFU9_9PLEO|nr:Cloroperoxidase [Macroventuria anomochaeta]KAF2633041.1 Cloroperoxidase [Macroventuria anomochaeta]
MKQNVLLLAATTSLASGRPQYGTPNPHEWIPGGPHDFRGPCPMLNTLTNHGFLPRDGRNFTKANVIKGLGDGLNFDTTLAGIMWDQAIIANPEPNATFFTLEQLNVHNVLEHDASLSRTDAAFGNNHVFNQTVFNTSKAWWTDEVVTAKQLAHSKIFRQLVSRAENENYTFSASTEEFSLGEVAAPIIAFGDTTAGTVPRELMVYFFENERLPEELGWSKKNASITLQTILETTAIVRNATSLLTGGETAPADPHKRRDLHSGLF